MYEIQRTLHLLRARQFGYLASLNANPHEACRYLIGGHAQLPQLGVAAAALVGSPQGIAPPRLPRFRTCRFPASGSSVHGFAT